MVSDWLQSTQKWLVLLALTFASLFLLFDACLSMGAPCSYSLGNFADPEDRECKFSKTLVEANLLQPCRKEYAGSLFALVVIFGLGSTFGRMVVALKMNLPPLLGMLFAGLLLKNLPFIRDVVGDNVNEDMSAHIRDAALAIILTRAGLGLDLDVLAKMKWVILRLAFMPCTMEALTVMGASILLLDFNWKWGMMLGWLWSAISPAVVVPSLLSLLERGYGTTTGIVPAAIAASALDDVMSIVCFSIFLDFATSGKPIEATELLGVPVQLVAGIAIGVILAWIVNVATRPKSDGEGTANDSVRIAAILLSSITSLLGLKKAGFTGCAALSVLVLALVAAKGWGPAASKRVAAPLTQLWNTLAQPLLFGLVGCQVDLRYLAPETVGFGLLMLACSLTARFGTAFLAMTGRGLKPSERLFTALSQLPKATVQAALCGLPRQKVSMLTKCDGTLTPCDIPADEDWKMWAQQVLQLSVVIILCTAPVGASIIHATGPKLLTQDAVKISSGESLVQEVDEPDPDITENILSFHEGTGPAGRGKSYDAEMPQSDGNAPLTVVPTQTWS